MNEERKASNLVVEHTDRPQRQQGQERAIRPLPSSRGSGQNYHSPNRPNEAQAGPSTSRIPAVPFGGDRTGAERVGERRASSAPLADRDGGDGARKRSRGDDIVANKKRRVDHRPNPAGSISGDLESSSEFPDEVLPIDSLSQREDRIRRHNPEVNNNELTTSNLLLMRVLNGEVRLGDDLEEEGNSEDDMEEMRGSGEKRARRDIEPRRRPAKREGDQRLPQGGDPAATRRGPAPGPSRPPQYPSQQRYPGDTPGTRPPQHPPAQPQPQQHQQRPPRPHYQHQQQPPQEQHPHPQPHQPQQQQQGGHSQALYGGAELPRQVPERGVLPDISFMFRRLHLAQGNPVAIQSALMDGTVELWGRHMNSMGHPLNLLTCDTPGTRENLMLNEARRFLGQTVELCGWNAASEFYGSMMLMMGADMRERAHRELAQRSQEMGALNPPNPLARSPQGQGQQGQQGQGQGGVRFSGHMRGNFPPNPQTQQPYAQQQQDQERYRQEIANQSQRFQQQYAQILQQNPNYGRQGPPPPGWTHRADGNPNGGSQQQPPPPPPPSGAYVFGAGDGGQRFAPAGFGYPPQPPPQMQQMPGMGPQQQQMSQMPGMAPQQMQETFETHHQATMATPQPGPQQAAMNLGPPPNYGRTPTPAPPQQSQSD